ncbi:hypothetical protein CCACVL1_26165 [Corchorus capsularis]|uniref:ZF-HD dimerization-type domain-containing protein n=1 Tax=Corchorus capsularis TaxID=210143 RepID=A0A1R3GFT5_COCAP|nr:hypothetical protein CCACVL1_26165 [Corchorus capsularis]
MELRGQDKEMGMPSSFSYNNNQLNRDSSSSKVSSSTPINSTAERRRDHHADNTTILNPNPSHQNQTLDHQNPLYHLHLNPQHQLNKPRRDPDPDPDPVPPQLATTGATVSPTADRSPNHHHQQPPPTSSSSQPPAAAVSTTTPLIRYRECMKNHAASMGGHVTDGCGEFMPGGEEGTPEALKCAACECHRNFHRKEINGESQYAPPSSYNFSHNPNKNNSRRDMNHMTIHLPPNSHQLHHQQPTATTPFHHQQRFSLGVSTSPSAMAPIAPVMMNFGGGGSGGGPAESSSEDLNMYAGGQSSAHPQSSKKRFRTKFSQEQKDKMMEFAEKLGWRIQKQDEQEVQQFCAQTGVKRQVFKVWMHNNKQAMKKKQM